MTRILSIDTVSQFAEAVEEACKFLTRGSLVAVPTETVYGLAANALDAEAVELIYKVKDRPVQNPVIVHVASLEEGRRCASDWPDAANLLAEAFWPGPLTLVLPKAAIIPSIVTAGGSTVALRWSSHPFMQRLIKRCGFPLAAPSANPANRVSPTTAAHVLQGLDGKIPLIVDAGAAAVGIESTVVDVSSGNARVLRPGMISADQIRTVTDRIDAPDLSAVGPLKSPGMLRKHYSPRARLVLTSWRNDEELLASIAAADVRLDLTHVIAHRRIPSSESLGRVSVVPEDPEAYARALYAELHKCDEEGAALIVVEELPETPNWEGIRDRLRRASAEN